jgi:hypothetical protein
MTIFGWCNDGKHSECIRTYQRLSIDPKSNKVVLLDEWRKCECPKRGCKCYVKPADRTKKRKKRKKNGKS